jgi:hypothetical protein
VRLALLDGAVAGLPSEESASSEDEPRARGRTARRKDPLKPHPSPRRRERPSRLQTGGGRILGTNRQARERHHRVGFSVLRTQSWPRLRRYARIERRQPNMMPSSRAREVKRRIQRAGASSVVMEQQLAWRWGPRRPRLGPHRLISPNRRSLLDQNRLVASIWLVGPARRRYDLVARGLW